MHGMEQLAEPICVCVLKLKLDMHNSTHALHNRLDQFVGNEQRKSNCWNLHLLKNLGGIKIRDRAMVPRQKILKMTRKVRKFCAFLQKKKQLTHPNA